MTRQRATRLMGQAARHSPAIRFRSVESVRTSAMYLLRFRRRIVAQLPRLTTISLTKVRVLSISIRLTRALTTALPGTTRYWALQPGLLLFVRQGRSWSAWGPWIWTRRFERQFHCSQLQLGQRIHQGHW